MRMLILKNMLGISVLSLIILEGASGEPVKRTPGAGFILTKDTTTNVEKRLMQLIEAPEELNSPDRNPNFPQMVPESDILDEPTFSDLDEESIPVSQMPEAELNSHINETEDFGATSAHLRHLKDNTGRGFTVTPASFAGNPAIIRPTFVSADDEEEEEEPEDPKPVPKEPKPAPNPYDPTNQGTSKGGGHKGNGLHYKTVGIHNIPIIRMGEEHQPNGAFTIIKPWVS
jgi:hypothetical protein